MEEASVVGNTAESLLEEQLVDEQQSRLLLVFTDFEDVTINLLGNVVGEQLVDTPAVVLPILKSRRVEVATGFLLH